MPGTPSARPDGGTTSTSDTTTISVQVKQTDMGLALRSEPEIRGDENLVGDRLPTGTRLISIERLNTGWHKVITLDGRMGYCSASYLDIISDINTCNEE